MSGQLGSASALNDIAERQNDEQFLRLLRARSWVYAVAARLQVVQLTLVVLLPIVGAIVGLIRPDAGPYVAFGSLIIAVLDTAWLDRWQRGKLKLAAKISEQFDCELLTIPWNRLVSGKYVDPELVEACARAWPHGDAKLRDWYPAEIRNVPLPLARVVCQRTNAWYDGSLRQRYGVWLLVLVCGAFIATLIAGLALKLSLLGLTTSILTPAAPAMIWCLREHFRQRDIIEQSESTKSEADSLCEKGAIPGFDENGLLVSSRELQNAIFLRRASSPLLLPFIYRFARSGMEAQMIAGAAALLRGLRQNRNNSP